MTQLQMLYSEWLDQDLVGWIQVSLLPHYLLVSTILKVITQLQMLYSEQLDQNLVGWIQVSLLRNLYFGFLVLAPTVAYCLLFKIGTIILRPDKCTTNNKVKFQVCFAPHELDYRFPSSSNDQVKYGSILNSFITFINHQDEYPFKIAKIQTEKY